MKVSSDQRRRDLTAAAVDLIIEVGPNAASARKIAQRAGAPLSILHYTFRDMDELMHLANAEVLKLASRAVEHVRTDRGIRAYISDLIHTYLQSMQDDDKPALAFFETFVSLIRPRQANDAVIDCQNFYLERLREAEKHDSQRSKIPLPQLATLMTMALDGLSVVHLARRDDHQTALDAEQLIAALHHLV